MKRQTPTSRSASTGSLASRAGSAFPFTPEDLAAAIDHHKYDRMSVQRILMALKDEDRVHYLAGKWLAGPLPPE